MCQMSRAIEQSEHRMPRLSDLRESGEIEQEADIVIFIHQNRLEKSVDHELKKLVVEKNRFGSLVTVKANLYPDMHRFERIC